MAQPLSFAAIFAATPRAVWRLAHLMFGYSPAPPCFSPCGLIRSIWGALTCSSCLNDLETQIWAARFTAPTSSYSNGRSSFVSCRAVLWCPLPPKVDGAQACHRYALSRLPALWRFLSWTGNGPPVPHQPDDRALSPVGARRDIRPLGSDPRSGGSVAASCSRFYCRSRLLCHGLLVSDAENPAVYAAQSARIMRKSPKTGSPRPMPRRFYRPTFRIVGTCWISAVEPGIAAAPDGRCRAAVTAQMRCGDWSFRRS